MLNSWRLMRASRVRVFLVGAFCDMDEEFKRLKRDSIGTYSDQFQKLPIIIELIAQCGGSSLTKVCVGSMKNITYTEELVYRVFSNLQTSS